MSTSERIIEAVRRTNALGLCLCVWALGMALSAEPARAASQRVQQAYAEYVERRQADQLAEALGPAKRAYDYAQQDLGVDDDRLALTAAALGALLLDLDRPVDALRPLTHARELYDHQRGPTSAKSRTMQRRIAEANQRLGRYEAAEKTYLDLIERAKGAEGNPTAELAGLYSRLQTLAEEAGALPRCRRYGLESMKLYRASRGPESLPEGLVAIRVANAMFESGDIGTGLDMLEYGTPILEKRLEAGDPQLTTLYEFVVEVYGQIGDTQRERRYRVRLKKNQKKEAEFARKRDAQRSAGASSNEASGADAEPGDVIDGDASGPPG